ncbi:helix-turn-helix transcriptional regulator [Streptomyces sp. DSM 44915]|uniref:Helix-turn-helix transcriptional regulator n=1 Tax=Streptomyces chisholmiae TaxID=3075540 RepID=A0ABU2JS91_9ACTN|nr:helix-turn-helix transcriptional regulator [Streptomyces sp. DSM 44915]MDT0267850.1 helix-turn-helix transcriptional regulator [Streptomyces sp. DSM 44915]
MTDRRTDTATRRPAEPAPRRVPDVLIEQEDTVIEQQIDAATVRVYQLRATHPTDQAGRLAARAGLTPDEVRAAERRLSRLGLLQPSPGGGWVAINPENAAEGLLAPIESDILRQRVAMAATRERLHALSGDYLEARSMRSAKSSIEAVEGIENIRAVIDDLARTCTESLDALVPGGGLSGAALRAAAPLDLELLKRGVRIRSLFQHSARRHRATAHHVERITAAGAEVRTAGVLGSRLQIYDGEVVVVPLRPEDSAAGVALVRDPSVVGYASQFFQLSWDDALDFDGPTGDGGPDETTAAPNEAPIGQERDVLLMMAAGLSNDEIADRLGVSQRSVSRVVAHLMDRLNATNRFQAGVEAASLGWLTN